MSQSIHKKATPKTEKLGITPLFDRVLLRPAKPGEGEPNHFGIIIPETVSQEKPEQGTVVAVGEGRIEDGQRIPMTVKVGDRVVFSRYGFDEVKIGGEDYYILKEENILAIISTN